MRKWVPDGTAKDCPHMPPELWAEVVLYLDAHDLAAMQQVSSHFKCLASNDVVWARLLARDFPWTSAVGSTSNLARYRNIAGRRNHSLSSRCEERSPWWWLLLLPVVVAPVGWEQSDDWPRVCKQWSFNTVFLRCVVVCVVAVAFGLVVLVRSLRRDFVQWNYDYADDSIDETGWKLLHGDAFRPPIFASSCATLVGGGCGVAACFAVQLLPAFPWKWSVGAAVSVLICGVQACLTEGHLKGRFTPPPPSVWPSKTTLRACMLLLGALGRLVPYDDAWPALFGAMVAMFSVRVVTWKRSACFHPVRTHQLSRVLPDVAWHAWALVLAPVVMCALMGGLMGHGLFSGCSPDEDTMGVGGLIAAVVAHCCVILLCFSASACFTYLTLNLEQHGHRDTCLAVGCVPAACFILGLCWSGNSWRLLPWLPQMCLLGCAASFWAHNQMCYTMFTGIMID